MSVNTDGAALRAGRTEILRCPTGEWVLTCTVVLEFTLSPAGTPGPAPGRPADVRASGTGSADSPSF